MTTDKPTDRYSRFDMPPQIRDRLRARAEREGITPAQALERALSTPTDIFYGATNPEALKEIDRFYKRHPELALI